MDFIVIIRVTTFEFFKMQMIINLAPVSLSNKEVNFYTCPRLTLLKKNTTENSYKSISEPLDLKIFWRVGGGGVGEICPVKQIIFSLTASFLRMFIAAIAVVKSYPK